MFVIQNYTHLLVKRRDKTFSWNRNFMCIFSCQIHNLHASNPEIENLERELIAFEALVPLSVESCISILQRCKNEKNLAYAKRVYKHMCDYHFETQKKLGSYIVAMFTECGSMTDARLVFDGLIFRNDYSWFSLLQGYNDYGQSEKVVELLPKLREDGLCPSSYTFQALLKACGRLKCIEMGRQAHAEIAKEGLDKDPFTGSNLVDMYVKCGSLTEAREVFDELLDRDVVLWTALLSGYSENGFYAEVRACLARMRYEGVSPNPVTYICGLKDCGSIPYIQELHLEIVKQGLERDSFLGNALLDVYAKQGWLPESVHIFSGLQVQSIVSWTSLISGHAEHDADEEALYLFEKMQYINDVVPDVFISALVLKSCGNVGALEKAVKMYCQVVKLGFEKEPFVGNALIDMYGKCGLLVEAQKVFDKMPIQDVVLWSALIGGVAFEGEIMLVFDLFEMMLMKGIQPDKIILLSILTMCTHAGLVDAGTLYFVSMKKEFGISQSIEHHNCIVDLLGRAGRLHDAVAMLEIMPIQPNLVTWVTLLGACRNEGNVELGRNALRCALKLQRKHSGSLLLAMQMLRHDR